MTKNVGKSMLAISSASDPAWLSSTHNPANFVVDMTNTMKMTRIVRICPNLIAMPRLFPNISEYNNVLRFYSKRVIEIPTGLSAPNDWLRTVKDEWEVRWQLVIPEGIYNIDQLLLLINGVVGPLGQTWTFDTDTMSIKIEIAAPVAPGYTFGYFTPAPVVAIDEWLPFVYLSGGASETLSTLGLEKAAFTQSIGFSDNLPFDKINPNSFDATRGTVLDGVPVLPLFDREQHSYEHWSTSAYSVPPLNSPNLDGPQLVHVLISELGDSNVINATTGVLYDVVKSVEMTQVEYGGRAVATVSDLESESITFQHNRCVTGFRVRVVDSKFRALKLPRNCEFNAILAIWFQQD